MTDNPSAAGPPPPSVSSNIRAEIARRGMSAAAMRRALADRGAPIAASTWDERMDSPGSWRLRELTAVASVLGIAPSVLVPDGVEVTRA